MFDEIDNNKVTLGSGVRPPAAARAEDIFSEVDKTVKPAALRPRDDNFSPASGTVIPTEESWLKNKILVFGLILGSLIIVIGGGYLGLRLMVKGTALVNDLGTGIIKEEVNNDQIAPEVMAPAVEEEINNIIEQPIQPVVTQPVDSDQDGLTDEEEANLGTNLNDPDTDHDGLTDREEAKVYNTDPLSVDTDGDGYPDGEEVKNGYNPKGPGKLLDINNQQ